MLDVKYPPLQKMKNFTKFLRLFPTPLRHAVEVVMCLHIFPVRLQTLLGCLTQFKGVLVGFGGMAALSLLDMWRALTWTFVHVSLNLSVTEETYRCYIAGKSP